MLLPLLEKPLSMRWMLPRLGNPFVCVACMINKMRRLLQSGDSKPDFVALWGRKRLENAQGRMYSQVCIHRSGMQLPLHANGSLSKRYHWKSEGWCLLVVIQPLVNKLLRILIAVREFLSFLHSSCPAILPSQSSQHVSPLVFAVHISYGSKEVNEQATLQSLLRITTDSGAELPDRHCKAKCQWTQEQSTSAWSLREMNKAWRWLGEAAWPTAIKNQVDL